MSVAERRQREREERRSLILDAAERIFYAKGLEAATMDDVAGAAGLGKGTLYLYFRNKKAVFLGIALRRLRALAQGYSEASAEARDGLDEVRRLLQVYATQMMSPPEHLRLILSCWVGREHFDVTEPGAVEHLEHIQHNFQALCRAVERGRGDGSVRPGPEAGRVAMRLWSAVNGALLLQLHLSRMPADVLHRQCAPSIEEAIEGHLESIRASRVGGEADTADACDDEPESDGEPELARADCSADEQIAVAGPAEATSEPGEERR